MVQVVWYMQAQTEIKEKFPKPTHSLTTVSNTYWYTPVNGNEKRVDLTACS